MITVRPVSTKTLARDGGPQHDFHLHYADDGEVGGVTVVRTHKRARVQYDLPADEARQLWRRLEARGYRRF